MTRVVNETRSSNELSCASMNATENNAAAIFTSKSESIDSHTGDNRIPVLYTYCFPVTISRLNQ